jgi:probable selenium-dependent hydroxylase accessory protein YqeC
MTVTDIDPWSDGRVIALVGAGGKTSLAWRITRRLLARGERVLFTTTTHCLLPAKDAFDVNILERTPEEAIVRLGQASWHSAFAAASLAGPFEAERANWMPTQPLKVRGFAPADIDVLQALDARLVVEADGGQGGMIKAPASHEPAIPSCADIVICVVCIDAIGKPLDGVVAHRPGLIAAVTGVAMGETLDDAGVARLLTSTEGGRKAIPPGARAIAALTRIQSARRPELESTLLSGGFDAVLDVDLSENADA